MAQSFYGLFGKRKETNDQVVEQWSSTSNTTKENEVQTSQELFRGKLYFDINNPNNLTSPNVVTNKTIIPNILKSLNVSDQYIKNPAFAAAIEEFFKVRPELAKAIESTQYMSAETISAVKTAISQNMRVNGNSVEFSVFSPIEQAKRIVPGSKNELDWNAVEKYISVCHKVSNCIENGKIETGKDLYLASIGDISEAEKTLKKYDLEGEIAGITAIRDVLNGKTSLDELKKEIQKKEAIASKEEICLKYSLDGDDISCISYESKGKLDRHYLKTEYDENGIMQRYAIGVDERPLKKEMDFSRVSIRKNGIEYEEQGDDKATEHKEKRMSLGVSPKFVDNTINGQSDTLQKAQERANKIIKKSESEMVKNPYFQENYQRRLRANAELMKENGLDTRVAKEVLSKEANEIGDK